MIVLGAGRPAAASEPLVGGGIDPACFTAANNSVKTWKLLGKPADEVEKLYQAALARCSGADPVTAAYVGTINFDLARFARRLFTQNLAPDAYLALSRDRGRKLRLSRTDPAWLTAYAQGDSDGDLVPDSKDQCPGTPDSTPTNNSGCVGEITLPKAPTASEIKKAQDALGVMVSPTCDGAPIPDTPQPVKAGIDFPWVGVLIGITHPNNQPAGCSQLYEVQIRFSIPLSTGQPATAAASAVFSRTESANAGAGSFLVFRAMPNDPAPRRTLYQLGLAYRKKEIRVRVMNGSGLTKGWSAPIDYDNHFFVAQPVQ
jgi:hypothetical protein